MDELFVKLSVDYEHIDARGKLSQLAHEGYSQVNVLETHGGTVRGGHYHKVSKEAFFVVKGSVEVSLRKGKNSGCHLFHPGDFFMIPPYTIHSMYFPDDCILVAMYDNPIEKKDGSMDIYKYIDGGISDVRD